MSAIATTDLQARKELVKLLESRNEPDRDLDVRIAGHFGIFGFRSDTSGFYTGSTDAALNLHAQVLATSSLTLNIDPSGIGAHTVWWPHGLSGDVEVFGAGVSCMEPLAILQSMFNALIAYGERE